MTHNRTTAPPVPSGDPTADRIASLSAEYLNATPERRERIGAEIAAMIDGRVVPVTARTDQQQ